MTTGSYDYVYEYRKYMLLINKIKIFPFERKGKERKGKESHKGPLYFLQLAGWRTKVYRLKEQISRFLN